MMNKLPKLLLITSMLLASTAFTAQAGWHVNISKDNFTDKVTQAAYAYGSPGGIYGKPLFMVICNQRWGLTGTITWPQPFSHKHTFLGAVKIEYRLDKQRSETTAWGKDSNDSKSSYIPREILPNFLVNVSNYNNLILRTKKTNGTMTIKFDLKGMKASLTPIFKECNRPFKHIP